MLVVLAIRKIGKPAWFTTRWGGWALNMGLSALGFMLLAPTISATVVAEGLLFGLTAAGGVKLIQDVKDARG